VPVAQQVSIVVLIDFSRRHRFPVFPLFSFLKENEKIWQNLLVGEAYVVVSELTTPAVKLSLYTSGFAGVPVVFE
jgi:hypothetical protein